MPRRLAASSTRLSTSAITARMCWRPALSRISASVVGGASYASPAWPEKSASTPDPRRLRKRHRPLDVEGAGNVARHRPKPARQSSTLPMSGVWKREPGSNQ